MSQMTCIEHSTLTQGRAIGLEDPAVRTISTIGYEGALLADFIATLKLAGIEFLIDVRELPQSRRPGFSKNILASNLELQGIGYLHLRALGDPKHGREAARRGDFDEFRSIFAAHMDRPEAMTALAIAGTEAGSHSSALMCFERNPKECHRAIVADRLSVLYRFQVRHLGVRYGQAECRDHAGGTVAAIPN